MDLTHELIDAIWRPHFVSKFRAVQPCPPSGSHRSTDLWHTSPVNPMNRLDSLPDTTWRVDGATICGTTFFVTPTQLGSSLIPLRLDVRMPDQGAHPVHLRSALDSSLSVPLRDNNLIPQLGISRLLCAALQSHCHRYPKFLEEYLRLPFGSRLVYETIESNAERMKLIIIPCREAEQQSKTVAYLQKLWAEEVPQTAWPKAIPLEQLHLVRQIHDSVSIVSLNTSPDRLFAFKSSVDNLDFVYHELKFLLSAPPHRNVMPCPPYLVRKRASFGGKHGILGFLLPYYPLGSIRDLLPARARSGLLSNHTKLDWCIQITTAIIHVQKAAGQFYSDLRPDNVLLVSDSDELGQHAERLVLCDFEQRGNWHEWCAPEVLYRQYALNMRNSSHDGPLAERWQRLVDAYMPASSTPTSTIEAKNAAWFSLSRASQEKAMVYSLGLFIYCVFEGMSNVRVNIANAYRFEPHIQFPDFQDSPAAIRDVIRRCTVDSPDWPGNRNELLPPRSERVVRIHDKLYGARYQASGCEDNVVEDVMQTGLRWWLTELERAESFLQTEAWKMQEFGSERPSLRTVLLDLEQMKLLPDYS
jgi:hypothetical protein